MRGTAACLLTVLANAASAQELVGIPTITDGDTVMIGQTKIRLLDMDAPETDQFCFDKEGKGWNCGIDAREALKKRVKEQEWHCQGNQLDRYGRLLASCMVGGENISSWM